MTLRPRYVPAARPSRCAPLTAIIAAFLLFGCAGRIHPTASSTRSSPPASPTTCQCEETIESATASFAKRLSKLERAVAETQRLQETSDDRTAEIFKRVLERLIELETLAFSEIPPAE